jgi:hypothetical protein
LIDSTRWTILADESVINLKNDFLNQLERKKNVGRIVVLMERVDVESQTEGIFIKDQGD